MRPIPGNHCTAAGTHTDRQSVKRLVQPASFKCAMLEWTRRRAHVWLQCAGST